MGNTNDFIQELRLDIETAELGIEGIMENLKDKYKGVHFAIIQIDLPEFGDEVITYYVEAKIA